MKAWGVLLVAGALAGCAGMPHEQAACPAGQEALKTAQLFFGRNIGGKPAVSQADFQRFMDAEVTPRFPDGLTVLEGGGQWRGSENQLIREAAKVVLIVLPRKGDAPARIDAVRTAYKKQFNQDSVLLITQPACVSF
jgi:hypothetical protein